MNPFKLFLLALPVSAAFGPFDSPKPAPRLINRVAVVGAGIAGLSLAHALENSPDLSSLAASSIQVSIFESRPSLNFETGAGIQLNGGIFFLSKSSQTKRRRRRDQCLIAWLPLRHALARGAIN